MMLSHDAACYIDWFRQDLNAGFGPAWHHGHLFDDTLRAPRQRGVTPNQIETMLAGNPRRCLSGPSGP
jgi:phosphotriesterase-related protein